MTTAIAWMFIESLPEENGTSRLCVTQRSGGIRTAASGSPPESPPSHYLWPTHLYNIGPDAEVKVGSSWHLVALTLICPLMSSFIVLFGYSYGTTPSSRFRLDAEGIGRWAPGSRFTGLLLITQSEMLCYRSKSAGVQADRLFVSGDIYRVPPWARRLHSQDRWLTES